MKKAARIVLGLALLVAALAAGVEFYARAPAAPQAAPLGVPPGTRVLVLLLHGSGGREEPTLVALERRLRGFAADRPGTAVIRYVWSPWSDSRMRARENGLAIGAAIGREAARAPGLEVVHVVSHSAGAYPSQAFCEAYRAGAHNPARVVQTFLDPIGFEGALDPGWGARKLGGCADYAEAVINTDDPVPATNAPLALAWNVDVTRAAARAAAGLDGHRWPVQWYLDAATAADLDGAGYAHGSRPRGAVTPAP
jgi:hypothetical protein